MNKFGKIILLLNIFLLISCGGKQEEKKEQITIGKKNTSVQKESAKPKAATKTPASKRVDLESKGVGPVTSLELPAEIDQSMVAKGQDIFKKMCMACHKPNKRFIGPAPTGILKRRSPEWVMNMILNPSEMVEKDPLAKELLIEFNGSPMANQSLTEEDARAVLEYFRTL
ncbi:c-type cytochrome [Aquimarina sediminis]|uniref:c-type cytochrome n=1 Tax=Aquimarina sediminis TaxID=2070536 RepID=UPI000CA0521A|nr:cytochrome c [Aquimarina sediminis]